MRIHQLCKLKLKLRQLYALISFLKLNLKLHGADSILHVEGSDDD